MEEKIAVEVLEVEKKKLKKLKRATTGFGSYKT